ncbi:hypothetical protein [Cryobacterium sp. MLB-32]|uniref:hypothetical protein n=1 Tax=Cryobacterium sp. MLB-32 TaxID=1529318 RepID=UPI000AA1C96B|nr:hypothetical protein [Cryobacterium sp. MLB-32]
MRSFAAARHRFSALAMIAALLGTALVAGLAPAPAYAAPPRASSEADEPAPFDPGSIVSDYNFFNPDAMTEDEIQTFLEERSCVRTDTAACAWEYREDTTDQPVQAVGHCSAYPGAPHEKASRIIAKVAEACTISPRVLLVLLQKEQSLLTRPTESGYLRATGYGCPDTADCDAEYFGFFNQVYNAAWQFRQYTQEPDRAYQRGAVDVGFNPNAECGASTVQIRNQATANLYNYTPYQPNAAALANIGDTGDECSTYGNLNFWAFYEQWFGDPASTPYPAVLGECLNYPAGQACRAPELLPTR